ncbi:hypothetical protein JW877_04170 [bacterium]|nr:hypothetical protein [bacterium]
MIKLLLVENSGQVSLKVKDLITKYKDLAIMDISSNQSECLDSYKTHHPDMVIMEPLLEGKIDPRIIKKIFEIRPVPVLIFIPPGPVNYDAVIEMLDMGACDFFTMNTNLSLHEQDEQLYLRIRAVSLVSLHALKSHLIKSERSPMEFPIMTDKGYRMIILGASTGGPQGISFILKNIPKLGSNNLIVALHMPQKFLLSFTRRLKKDTGLDIRMAEDGMEIYGGMIMVAPGDYSIVFDKRNSLITIKKYNGTQSPGLHPSIDLLMSSAATLYGNRTLGIILSGMGKDGVEGMRAIHQSGGFTIAQDRNTSVVYGMPRAVKSEGFLNMVLGLPDIPLILNNILN